MTESRIRVFERGARWALAGAMALGVTTGAASAQTPAPPPAPPDPNSGALTLTAGLDVPTKYVFRGIVQESDSNLTLFPYADGGVALYSGEGGLKSASVNVGVWNALLTGSSGSDGPQERKHYELDFYTALTLGFGKGISVATTYTAYTSPNGMFNPVQEIAFKVSKAHWLNPNGTIAFELQGQADGGENRGTYLELGVAPSWPLADGKLTVSVPVKFGFSIANYYELDGEDNKFGYFQGGGLLTLPLSDGSSNFGAWNIHGGVDFYGFGKTTKFFNNDNGAKVVASFGVGLVY